MTPPFGLWRILFVAACSLTVAGSARAAETVDVQLVLAVDVSLSMSPEELEIQRRGYATAMADRQVIAAITDGAYGRIAVTYVEWAGKDTQRVIVPWTVIASRADAEAFASKLTEEIPRSARRTSISGGLAFSADLIA
ncbi:MAG: DUF1194 domain-containing protein, partial [Rhizobiales bacterium]|nr:DUF1194 domain-containing protein [Hyphomicrobiales bacterium]